MAIGNIPGNGESQLKEGKVKKSHKRTGVVASLSKRGRDRDAHHDAIFEIIEVSLSYFC